MKKYIIIVFVLLIVVFATLIAFQAAPEKKNDVSVPQDKILYFYSDTCHYCIQQKPILEELEKDDIKFERMDVGENRDYYTQYKIEGTPTFIFKDMNTRLTGLQTKEALKKFWDDNK